MRRPTVGRVLTFLIVRRIFVAEYVLPCGFASDEFTAANAFPSEGLEAKFGFCAVATSAAPNSFDVVLAKQRPPLAADYPRFPSGMDNPHSFGFAPPYSCERGMHDQVGSRVASGRPDDDAE